jgi:hypothetical protein
MPMAETANSAAQRVPAVTADNFRHGPKLPITNIEEQKMRNFFIPCVLALVSVGTAYAMDD